MNFPAMLYIPKYTFPHKVVIETDVYHGQNHSFFKVCLVNVWKATKKGS